MSWARATLRRGTSSGSVWQVDANYPQARVVVGTAANAGWVVSGPGVAMFHVELYWDGNALYVNDPQAVGDVRLNGQLVTQWTQVKGRGQLVFGHAILELETAVAETTAMVKDPGTAPRVSLVGEATRVAQPLTDFDDEDDPTSIARAADEIPGSKVKISQRPPPPPGRAPAASMPPPPPNRAPQATAPAGVPAAPNMERPRLGGAPGVGRKEAKTLVGEELVPIGQEATRMVDTDALAAGGQPQGFGAQPQGFGAQPQGFGAQPQGFGAQPQGFGAQPQGFGAQPQGFGAQPQGFGAQPQGFGAQPQGFGADPLGFGNAPLGGGAPGASGVQVDASAGSPSATGAMAPATSGFVPPPSITETKVDPSEGGAVPRRTRLMMMLFAAVVIAWLMMPTPEEEEAALRAAQPATVAAIPPGVDGGVDAGPRQYVSPSTFVPVLTTEPVAGALARTPDSVGAQLVNDGRLEDALVQYEALRAAHPERPEYGVMCEVLRRRLMQRCVNGQLWNGSPCVAP